MKRVSGYHGNCNYFAVFSSVVNRIRVCYNIINEAEARIPDLLITLKIIIYLYYWLIASPISRCSFTRAVRCRLQQKWKCCVSVVTVPMSAITWPLQIPVLILWLTMIFVILRWEVWAYFRIRNSNKTYYGEAFKCIFEPLKSLERRLRRGASGGPPGGSPSGTG